MSKPVVLVDDGKLTGVVGTSDGQVLTWNASTEAWEAQTGGSGSGTVTSVTAGAGLDGGTITTSGTISMPSVGTADTYGSASSVPVIVTDAQGRVSGVTNTAIAIAESQVTGLVDALAGKVPTTRTVSTTSGQLTGGGALSGDLTLGLATAGTSGDYGSASSVPVFHTDAYGRVTSVTPTSIAITTSQVTGLDTALAGKALKSTTISAGTGISVTGGGTLGDNNTITLASGVVTPAAKGTASKSASVTVDTYGRVTTLTDQDIAIAASQITSGQLSLNRGGTGIDASGVTAGELLIGATGGGALALQTVSQDATLAASGALTVTGLQTHAVSSAAPVSGQVLQYNGTNWTPGIIPNGGSGGGGRVFYLDFGNTTGVTPNSQLPQSTTSTPSTSPSLLGIGYDVGSGSVQSANLTNGSYSLVAGFVTIPNTPGVTNIPAGLWDFNIWASATAGNSNTQVQMQARVYIVSGDGTKYGSASGSNDHVALASSDAVYIYDQDTTAQYILNVTMPQTTILATDRIYIELWAQKNVSQTRYIYFYFDSLHPSHVHTTIPSVAGTGIVHVVDGVFQSPASPVALGSADVSGTLLVANGGTGAATLPIHQVLLGNGTSAIASVSLGAGQVLIGTTSNSPAAATISSGTGVTVSSSSGTISVAIGQAVGTSDSPTFANITDSGLSASQYVKTDSSKKLVSSATIAASDLAGQVALAAGGTGVDGTSITANYVFAGPTSGGAASASFRALVASDIPSLSSTYMPVAGGTFTGKVTFPASSSSAAGISLGSSGSAPSSPSTGDVWWTSTNTLFAYLGSSQQVITSAPGQTTTITPATVSSGTGYGITLLGGANSANTSFGGAINLTGGSTIGTSSTAGSVNLAGGNSTGTTSTGGSITLRGGTGTSANGSVTIGATNTASVGIGASAITTTLNGTLNAPNVSTGTIATFLALTSGGNIIKTAASTIPVANGGTGAALSVAQGAVIYASSATALDGLAAGTNGQFLMTQGASANPTFSGVPYDLSAASVGTYSNSQVIFRFIAPRAVTITSTGSYFKALTASSGTVTVAVAQSGSASTSFNVTYSVAGGTTGSVPSGTTISMQAGDVLTVTTPASADATLAGIYFTLKGTALGV